MSKLIQLLKKKISCKFFIFIIDLKNILLCHSFELLHFLRKKKTQRKVDGNKIVSHVIILHIKGCLTL